MARRNRGEIAAAIFVAVVLLLLAFRYPLRGLIPASDGPLSDMFLVLLPQRGFADAVLEAGGRPMWNPMVGFGNDELTTLWFYPAYPTTFLTRLLGLWRGVGTELLLHLVLAFAAMMWLVRHLGRSRLAALVAGFAFAGSGLMVGYLFAPILVISAAWLPLMFLFADRLAIKPNFRDTALFAGVCGLHLLAGMPQYTLYFALMCAPWIVWRLIDARQSPGHLRRFVAFAMMAAIPALMIGAGKLIPWVVNLSRMRGGYEDYAAFAGGLFHLSDLAGLIAPQLAAKLTGGMTQAAVRAHIGLVPLALAAVALVTFHKQRAVRYFAVIFVAALAFVIDWPLVKLAWQHLPLFASFTPVRLWLLGGFSAAVLSAYGADAVIERAKKHHAIVGAALVFAAGGLALAVCWQVNPAYDPSTIYRETPITSALTAAPGRLLRVGKPYSFIEDNRVYESQALLLEPVADLNTFGLMPDKPLMRAYYNRVRIPDNVPAYFTRTRILPADANGLTPDFLDELAVTYLAAFEQTALPPSLELTESARHGRLVLYRRNNKAPLFGRLIGENSVTEAQATWAPDYNEAVFRAVDGGMLEFLQSPTPGWHASVDGTAATIATDNDLFMRVTVPPGKHDVRFVFDPGYVKTADWITALGYALLGLMLGAVLGRTTTLPKWLRKQTK